MYDWTRILPLNSYFDYLGYLLKISSCTLELLERMNLVVAELVSYLNFFSICAGFFSMISG
jgi:hypothetical protein